MSKETKLLIALLVAVVSVNILFDLSNLMTRLIASIMIVGMIVLLILMIYVGIICTKEIVEEIKGEKDKD